MSLHLAALLQAGRFIEGLDWQQGKFKEVLQDRVAII